jgi:hypothetical protein
MRRFDDPMVLCVVMAMSGRGKMSNKAIYREVKKVSEQLGRPLLANWDAHVRQTLQAHCPGRPQHNGRDDFFVWHGRGYWSCKVILVSTSELLDDI